MNFFATAVVKL